MPLLSHLSMQTKGNSKKTSRKNCVSSVLARPKMCTKPLDTFESKMSIELHNKIARRACSAGNLNVKALAQTARDVGSSLANADLFLAYKFTLREI